MSPPYRDFYYPLNVFVHILTAEEGEVRYLHYGLFEEPGESIAAAQQRSTDLLLSRLPEPPARLLDVGCGIGTTLSRLTAMGYEAVGITPDENQIAFIRSRFDSLHVVASTFESFQPDRPFQALLFQESSQYIPSAALFAHAAELSSRVIVLDEFATRPVGHLHSLQTFLDDAAAQGFAIAEQLDVSSRAAPTIDYFMERIPRFRDRLIADLGLTREQVDDLLRSGETYVEAYRKGDYVYRLFDLRREL